MPLDRLPPLGLDRLGPLDALAIVANFYLSELYLF
ncbi:hypothetical protein CMEL01_08243 [Colletotrichum melonis]|uniref:Uncharacterized protein n=1 Tax=Colletotrichum melonis TaxID=1209925 RepID=A0AAI9U220_9PEZI|nr:hypothetical protein CMEL01_08243 [Colletotrichum melonis]